MKENDINDIIVTNNQNGSDLDIKHDDNNENDLNIGNPNINKEFRSYANPCDVTEENDIKKRNKNAELVNLTELEKSVKSSVITDKSNYFNLVIYRLLPDNEETNFYFNETKYSDINDIEFEDAGYKITDLKSPVISGSTSQLFNVDDDDLVEDYTSSLSNVCDTFDKAIDNHTKNDEIGILQANAIKSNGLRQMQRSLDGYGTTWVNFKTPLGLGAISISSVLAPSFTDDCRNNIKKWNDKIPAFSLLIEGEDQIQTFVDYTKEKENKTLTTKKENTYRQKLYTQSATLLHYIEMIDNGVSDYKTNCELVKDGFTDKFNNPFHMHSTAPRGLGVLKSSCTAYKDCIKNGWPIDDIGYIATFKYILDNEINNTLCKRSSELANFVKYDEPKYKSEEHKNYLKRMTELYNDVASIRLTSAKDRKNVLDDMYNIIQEGVSKGYIDINSDATSYFAHQSNIINSRNRLIEKGKEAAFSKYEVKDYFKYDVKLTDLLTTLNSKRSRIFVLSGESNEHKQLREQTEALIGLENKKPKKPSGSANGKGALEHNYLESLQKYSEDYFEQLDYLITLSKNYQTKNNDPGTPAGKERLRGAKDIEAFAKKEQHNLMKELKKANPVYADKTFEEIRTDFACKKAERHINEINDMEKLPTGKEDQKKLMDKAADILAASFAKSASSSNVKAFNTLGAKGLADEIKKSKEFKTV
ncbi:MAG: hypothetical protein K6G11_02460, partial [Lachnospiraceae bacterium]|nr:hypothetical protein [Lachnospiraceae bacterium]